MKKSEHPYRYSTKGAIIYETLGIRDTTYEAGFLELQRLLGDVRGRQFLDFGCGTGRSSEFLRSLGAVVHGVDHNLSMVEQAQKKTCDGMTFTLMEDVIPAGEKSMDGAISANVFIEIKTLDYMREACREVARVLKPDGVFVVMSANPAAFRSNFRNFSYSAREGVQSGEGVICTLKSQGQSFDIQDTFWQEKDYLSALESSGFVVESVTYPRPDVLWDTDESKVPPFIVLKAKKYRHE